MTTLPHLAARVFDTPLMIDATKLNAVLAALAPRLGVEPPAADIALMAEHRSRKPYAVSAAGIAVIEASGSLVNRASGMDAQSGLTSYEQLGNEVLDAATDPQVRGILLRVDSYGGEANGAWDAADLIAQAAQLKPVWASVDDWALSGGYLLASAADRVWVTRTGAVGSIGVIAMHLDQSGFDAAHGLKYTTVFAGDRKNDLNAHEPPSEEALDVLAAEVHRLYGMFVGAVAGRRGLSVQAVRNTEAGIFHGADAVARGLADRVGTFREALAEMSAQLQPTTGGFKMSDTLPAAAAPPEPTPNLAALASDARDRGYAEAAEIVELCGLTGHPGLAGEFIARRLSASDVRKELLALKASEDSQAEIRSHVLPNASTGAPQNLDENPVVKACAALGARGDR